MLNLCDQIFARHGIRSLRYDGKMGQDAREYTLQQFRRPGGPKVILVRYVLHPPLMRSYCLWGISIKCGGVGLNLVSANRVIKCVPFLSMVPRGDYLSMRFIAWTCLGTSPRSPKLTTVCIALDRRSRSTSSALSSVTQSKSGKSLVFFK